MANLRVYDFTTGIETGTQPDAGTPTLSNDLVTLGFVGTPKQEQCSGTVNGVNATFTISQSPINADNFQLYLNGVLLRVTTHYTRSGTTITMQAGSIPQVGQELDAIYRY
jgi:hypothetical protein